MNAVFIHIPRTAGRFIIQSLGLQKLTYPHKVKTLFRQEGAVTFGHQNYRAIVQRGTISKEFDSTAFKFTFCRNPFDRAVSHYHYTRIAHPDIVNQKTSFLEWSRRIGSYIKRRRGIVFRTQNSYIKHVDIHFVGRFERLVEDLKTVANKLGVELSETENKWHVRHAPYRECYTEESQENVRRYYAEDFERFGYDDTVLH